MSVDVCEREKAKKRMIEMISDSLKDKDNTSAKVDGPMFLNEMKLKYCKKLSTVSKGK